MIVFPIRSLLKLAFSKRLVVDQFHKSSSLHRKYSVGLQILETNNAKHYKPGDELFGFSVKEVSDVSELHLTAIRLQHLKTGADYLHVLRNDSNNVFSVAFRTPPPDSTGICHILEHLALCGSKEYPCRDPFFKMLNRSVATFMNAFTGSDYTMYAFSTQNYQDFNNLLHVYLDAAFFPLLRKMDFSQEGWRLEHENIDDNVSPIILKGVVLNEMKAMYSSSAYLFHENLLNKMLPSNAYKFMSGGDPLEIPKLTWQQLKEYHQTFYHPSNARFFSYGTFPLDSHLANLDQWVLSKFNKLKVSSKIASEPYWTIPRSASVPCFPDPVIPNPNRQTTFALTYLLDEITNSYESFTLSILSHLLVEGANSPFYKALLLPGMGEDYSPASGFIPHNKQGMFSVGLTGIDARDIDNLKSRIEQTFDDVIKDGFPLDRIEAVLHLIELGFKHQTQNFGLSLAMALNSTWNHDGDPISSLQINDHIKWFRDQLAKNPCYLQEKVLQYFKNNNHKLALTMKADNAYAKGFEDKLQQILLDKLNGVTQKEKNEIWDEGKNLANFQRDTSESVNLPTLLLSEINTKAQTTTIKTISIQNTSVFVLSEPTNGVAYFHSVLGTSHLPDNLKPFLPVFCNILTQMGAGKLDYMQQDQMVSLRTGGLSSDVHISEHPSEVSLTEEGILVSSHCLERNTEHMFSLWQDIFNNLSLDNEERFAQLLKANASDLVQNLSFVSHSYAIRYAGSTLNNGGSLRELYSGLTHVTHLKRLAGQDSCSDVMDKLKEIAKLVLNRDNMRCAIHTTPEHGAAVESALDKFLMSLPKTESGFEGNYHGTELSNSSPCTHFVMPFPVNYVAKGQPTTSFSHSDYATIKVAAALVSAKYLHREIREIGGAYGSGVSLSKSGIWSFYSYRDPNVESTLSSFNQSTNWLLDGKFTDEDVNEAKLKAFSEMDQPIPPGSRGLAQFLSSIDDQMRQQYRDNLFLVTKPGIQNVTAKYLNQNTKFGVTVIGPKNEFTSSGNWTVINETNQ